MENALSLQGLGGTQQVDLGCLCSHLLSWAAHGNPLLRLVTEFSKKTGDYPSLSATDIQVLALTYQLEAEIVGAAHLKKEPEQVFLFLEAFLSISQLVGFGFLTLPKAQTGFKPFALLCAHVGWVYSITAVDVCKEVWGGGILGEGLLEWPALCPTNANASFSPPLWVCAGDTQLNQAAPRGPCSRGRLPSPLQGNLGGRGKGRAKNRTPSPQCGHGWPTSSSQGEGRVALCGVPEDEVLVQPPWSVWLPASSCLLKWPSSC